MIRLILLLISAAFADQNCEWGPCDVVAEVNSKHPRVICPVEQRQRGVLSGTDMAEVIKKWEHVYLECWPLGYTKNQVAPLKNKGVGKRESAKIKKNTVLE